MTSLEFLIRRIANGYSVMNAVDEVMVLHPEGSHVYYPDKAADRPHRIIQPGTGRHAGEDKTLTGINREWLTKWHDENPDYKLATTQRGTHKSIPVSPEFERVDPDDPTTFQHSVAGNVVHKHTGKVAGEFGFSLAQWPMKSHPSQKPSGLVTAHVHTLFKNPEVHDKSLMTGVLDSWLTHAKKHGVNHGYINGDISKGYWVKNIHRHPNMAWGGVELQDEIFDDYGDLNKNYGRTRSHQELAKYDNPQAANLVKQGGILKGWPGVHESIDEVTYGSQGDMKGWMSPSGEPNLFDTYDEHHENPPCVVPKSIQGFDKVAYIQKQGYARFGHAKRDLGHEITYVHYDHSNPEARKAAAHVLKFIKPSSGSRIVVKKLPGLSPIDQEETHSTQSSAMSSIRGVSESVHETGSSSDILVYGIDELLELDDLDPRQLCDAICNNVYPDVHDQDLGLLGETGSADGVTVHSVELPELDDHLVVAYHPDAHTDLHRQGLGYLARNVPEIDWDARFPKLPKENLVGYARFHKGSKAGLRGKDLKNADHYFSADTHVDADWRRKGVASAMYRHAANILPIKPSLARTTDAHAFWKSKPIGEANKTASIRDEFRKNNYGTSKEFPDASNSAGFVLNNGNHAFVKDAEGAMTGVHNFIASKHGYSATSDGQGSHRDAEDSAVVDGAVRYRHQGKSSVRRGNTDVNFNGLHPDAYKRAIKLVHDSYALHKRSGAKRYYGIEDSPQFNIDIRQGHKQGLDSMTSTTAHHPEDAEKFIKRGIRVVRHREAFEPKDPWSKEAEEYKDPQFESILGAVHYAIQESKQIQKESLGYSQSGFLSHSGEYHSHGTHMETAKKLGFSDDREAMLSGLIRHWSKRAPFSDDHHHGYQYVGSPEAHKAVLNHLRSSDRSDYVFIDHRVRPDGTSLKGRSGRSESFDGPISKVRNKLSKLAGTNESAIRESLNEMWSDDTMIAPNGKEHEGDSHEEIINKLGFKHTNDAISAGYVRHKGSSLIAPEHNYDFMATPETVKLVRDHIRKKTGHNDPTYNFDYGIANGDGPVDLHKGTGYDGHHHSFNNKIDAMTHLSKVHRMVESTSLLSSIHYQVVKASMVVA